MEAFALTDAATAGEPWRLWTGHLAHYGARHALINAAALIPPLLILTRRAWIGVAIWAVVAAPLVSLLILRCADVDEYRGASALVIGVWCLAAIVSLRPGRAGTLPMLMLVLVAGKLVIESIWRVSPMSPPPLVAAHWFGAAAGVAGALLWLIVHRYTPRRARRAAPEVATGPPDRGGAGRHGPGSDV